MSKLLPFTEALAFFLLCSVTMTCGQETVLKTSPMASANALENQRQKLDATVWKQEVEAQEFEETITKLWDELRNREDAFEVFRELDLHRFSFGSPVKSQSLGLGIRRIEFGAANQVLNHQKIQSLLEYLEKAGFQVVESEWHHSNFSRDTEGTAKSLVSFVLHVVQRSKSLAANEKDPRLIFRGQIEILWDPEQVGAIRDVTVAKLNLLTRVGPPAFQKVFTYRRRSNDVASAHPILVQDLDGNFLPEIIIHRWNRVYWNEGKGKFRESKLIDAPIPLAEAGIIADVNSDRMADFVSIDKLGRLVVFKGNRKGRFQGEHSLACKQKFPAALAITAGDIDQDGDNDLWVAQYKPAYLDGQMPTPYYDANDGEPGYLLLNDGTGKFQDATELAGLAKNRHRRTYSSSFVDLDHDSDLDLLKVSDYAGVDIFLNDGRGKFRDATEELISQRHLFGMAHVIADFNADGRNDIYAIGMSSTTARRLDAMKLGRSDREDVQRMRAAMGFGNRMYCFADGKYETPLFASQVARTGWSWGATAFDFDLDGDRDIYVANGFRSGDSCRDYCTTFWRHDIYTGDSKPTPAIAELFKNSMQELNQGSMSWNGYEHNALLLNDANTSFHNVGFLMGVGCEFDSRVVIGNDLDANGYPDLIVSEYESVPQGFITTVHVYRNTLKNDNHWIGIRLSGDYVGHAFGTSATIFADGLKLTQQIISGDSFLSQHDSVFILG